MQELTDYMKTYFHLTDESLEMFDKALEKEKEQIIDAYYGKIDGVYGYREAGEEYYNQTYNQKQYIIDIMKADEDDELYSQDKPETI